MYTNGQKVQVIVSSCKKKASPRQGSIGYIENIKWFGKNFDRDLYTCLCTVRFFRYGFDSNRYPEMKSLLAVFALNDKHDVIKYKEAIEEDVKEIKSKGLVSKTPIITIMKPLMDNTDLCTCSNHEFLAWYLACTKQTSFATFVSSLTNGIRYYDRVIEGIDNYTLEVIQDCLNNTEAFRNNREDIVASRNEVIKTITLIKTRQGNTNLARFRNNIESFCANGNKKNSQRYLSTRLIQSLFTYSGFNSIINTYKVFQIPFDEKAETILKYRSVLLNTYP